MSYTTLNRIGGLIVMLAGIAAILFNAVLWTGVIPRSWEYPGYLVLQTLFLFALIALLVRHAERPGVLLLVGFTLATIDGVLSRGFSYYASFAFPILRDQFPDAVQAVLSGPVGTISMVTLAIGLLGNIMFFAATLRAKIVPRWASILVIFATLLVLAMPPYNLAVIIGSVGYIGIGYAMFAGKSARTSTLQAQPTS